MTLPHITTTAARVRQYLGWRAGQIRDAVRVDRRLVFAREGPVPMTAPPSTISVTTSPGSWPAEIDDDTISYRLQRNDECCVAIAPDQSPVGWAWRARDTAVMPRLDARIDLPPGHAGHIYHVHVEAEYRRSGIASALLGQLCQADGRYTALISVSNVPSQRLFTKNSRRKPRPSGRG